MFCINVDIDEIFLLEKNEGRSVDFFRVISFIILEKAYWFVLLILIYNLRNLFIFCINMVTGDVAVEENMGFIPLWLFPFVFDKLLWHENGTCI